MSARAKGCEVLDGGRMAVGQAADAFRIFTGLEADADRMRGHFLELVAAGRGGRLMRTGIATVCLSGTLKEKMQACAIAGFDGIEIFEQDLVTSPADARRTSARWRPTWASPWTSTSRSATSTACPRTCSPPTSAGPRPSSS